MDLALFVLAASCLANRVLSACLGLLRNRILPIQEVDQGIMNRKVKAKTYGKRPRRRDLVEAFGTLALSDGDRPPLAERSANTSKTIRRLPDTEHPTSRRDETSLSCSCAQTPSLEKPTEKTDTVSAQPLDLGHSRRKLRPATKSTSPAELEPCTEDFRSFQPLTTLSDVESVVQQFNLWAETMDKLLNIVMIGDGTFANVFRLSSKSNPEQSSIAKLIPLRPKRGPGSRSSDLTTIENAASEVRVLAKLSGITGFTDFRRAMLLRGQLPQSFRNACKAFDAAAGEKERLTPDSARSRRLNYPKQQIWLFIDMGDAGEELEHILLEGLSDGPRMHATTPGNTCLTTQQARDIFYSTVEALALGEHEARFEHRDLHLSNVCLKRIERDQNAKEPNHDWDLVPKAREFAVTLIDYTLSRADTAEGTVFNPMDDEEIFLGEGNFQYDIYRHMRQAICDESSLDWSAFAPRTNVIWLHYILVRLLERTAAWLKLPHGKVPG